MAEKEESALDAADQKGTDQAELPENNVAVEEIGPARVRIKIEIPPERIEARLDSDLDELRRTATVPGFRVGRAPRKLIEKRFGTETRDRLKDVLVAEALQGAIEKQELKTLGEPELDFEKIELPESGPMCFEVETDIEPAFDLPKLEGIPVSKSPAEVEDSDVEETIKAMLAREGVYEPVTKGGAKKGDQVIGDLWLKVDDKEVTRRDDMALLAGPTKMTLMSVEMDKLCQNLVGAKGEAQVTAEVKVGEDHAEEELRGKKAVVGIEVKDIKRMKIPPLTGEWLKKAGWGSEEEFRSVMKENLQRQAEQKQTEDMRTQIRQYLTSETKLELPENLTTEQTARAENRQLVRIMQMGIPEEQAREVVAKRADETRNQALEETKLFFVLNRVAGEFNIEVDDAEVNGQIARMAVSYGTRPEKMRRQLADSGQLSTMANQIREQKVLDKLLDQAKITETETKEKPATKAKAKAKTKTKSTTKAKPKTGSAAKAKQGEKSSKPSGTAKSKAKKE